MKFKSNLYSLILIIFILPSVIALYEKCTVGDIGNGICVYKSTCKIEGGQIGKANLYEGYCNKNDGNNVQCCIKTVTTLKDGTTNLSNIGSCKNVNDCPADVNIRYSNECPGNNDIKLCVPKPSITTKSKTTTTLLPQPTQSIYNYKVGVRTMDIIKSVKKHLKNDDTMEDLHHYVNWIDNHKDILTSWDQYIVYWEAKFVDLVVPDAVGNFILNVGDTTLNTVDGCIDQYVDLINIRHIAFSIDNYIFEFNSYKNKEGKTMVGYYLHINEMQEIESYDWEYLSDLSGTTTISPIEMDRKIKAMINSNEVQFKTQEAKYLNGLCCTEYNLFLNNCHDFVKMCLIIVNHNFGDLNKFITFKKEMSTDTYIIDDLKIKCPFTNLEDFSNWFVNTMKDLVTQKESECNDPKYASISNYNDLNNNNIEIQSCNVINANNYNDNVPTDFLDDDYINNEQEKEVNEAKKICKSSIKSFIETNKCFISYNTMDDDYTKIDFEKCKILNTEECQNLIKIKFENIDNVIPECKDIDGSDEFEVYDEIFVDFYSIKNSVLACSMDENNKLCPFTTFYRSNFVDEDEDEDEHKSSNEAIKESCKSKRCTDSLKDYFEYLKITYDEDDDDQVREKKSFEYLYSNECTSQTLNSDNDSNSDKDSDNISDNNLNTSGFEKITSFPYQHLSCLLMIIFTWWMYTSH